MAQQQNSPRRVTVAVASVGLHVLLFIAFLGTKPGQFVAAAGDDVGAVTVALVPASSLTATSAAAPSDPTAGALTPLLAKFNPETTAVITPSTPGPVSDLLVRLGRRAAADRPASPADHVQRSAESFERPLTDQASEVAAQARAANGANPASDAAGDPGALWGAMEPCWRKLNLASSRTVTLNIVLDLQGHIAKPPEIVRTGGRPDEPQFRSEARALEGLTACMPHNGLRFGGRTYHLVFPAGNAPT